LDGRPSRGRCGWRVKCKMSTVHKLLTRACVHMCHPMLHPTSALLVCVCVCACVCVCVHVCVRVRVCCRCAQGGAFDALQRKRQAVPACMCTLCHSMLRPFYACAVGAHRAVHSDVGLGVACGYGGVVSRTWHKAGFR